MPRDRGRLHARPRRRRRAGSDRRRAPNDPSCSPACCRSCEALAHYIPIAIVSGRSVADLEHLYAFPGDVVVVGSHGLETRGGPSVELDDHERARLDTLRQLAREAEVIAGTGAWIEQKPASVVLHVRQARRGARSPGHQVVGRRGARDRGRPREDRARGRRVAGTLDEQGRCGRAAAAPLRPGRRRLRRRRPHRRGGVRRPAVRTTSGCGSAPARQRRDTAWTARRRSLEWLSALRTGFAEATDGRGRYYEL